MDKIEVTFENVTITLEASSQKEAYERVCDGLAAIPGCEFMTDTYKPTIQGGYGDTEELWPTYDEADNV